MKVTSTSNSKVKKRKLDIDMEIVKAIKNLSSQPEPDEFALYCSSLAPKLRRIQERDPIRVGTLQVDIQHLIMTAEMETL